MIRFKVTGADFLELKSGTEIQFQYNNSTLAIGNVRLSRSTEFMIPKTPKNESLLLFSSNIAGSGALNDLVAVKVGNEVVGEEQRR